MNPGSISSKAAALGLLLLVIALLVVLVFRPLWERHASNRELIAELESQLARFEQISNRESRLEKELVMLTNSLERSGLMLEAKTATLASAQLQERIKNTVAETGGTLASTQVMVGELSDGFQRVSVNARMTGSISELQATLYGLESTLPALVLDHLFIVTQRSPVRLRNQESDVDEQLDARFQVTGFYNPRTSQN